MKLQQNIKFITLFLLYSLVVIFPMDAMAATISETLGKGICEIISSLNGLAGKSVASLAVMFIAIAAFFGKANWGLVVTVVVGIGVIFGAKPITQAFTGIDTDAVCAAGGTFSGIGDAVGQGLCVAAKAITGNVGKALSSIAVIIVALTAMFGRINWGTVLINIAAIGTLFGAGAIVNSLAATNFDGDCLPQVVSTTGGGSGPTTITFVDSAGNVITPNANNIITTTNIDGVLTLTTLDNNGNVIDTATIYTDDYFDDIQIEPQPPVIEPPITDAPSLFVGSSGNQVVLPKAYTIEVNSSGQYILKDKKDTILTLPADVFAFKYGQFDLQLIPGDIIKSDGSTVTITSEDGFFVDTVIEENWQR